MIVSLVCEKSALGWSKNMPDVPGKKEVSLVLPCLHLLVPPLRLVSATIWNTIQHQVVSNYGLLDDFVTMVTDIVPELLNLRQRSLLSLGLRAQLILELCRPNTTVDLKTIQPHLDRMQMLRTLLKREAGGTGDDSSGSNILACFQALIENQEERQIFFQDVFPVKFGPKYNEALQTLMLNFLLRLEKLLAVPNLQQVACMLSDDASVLPQCVDYLSNPHHLKSVLQYQRHLSQLCHNGDLTVRDCICTGQCLQPMGAILTGHEETVLEAAVLTDYTDPLGKPLLKQGFEEACMVIKIREKCEDTETNSLKEQSFVNGKEGANDNFPYTIQNIESSCGDSVDLDSCAIEVQVGYNVEIPSEELVPLANKNSMEKMIATKEDEPVDVTQRAADDDSSYSVKCAMDMAPIHEEPAIKVLNHELAVTVSPRPVRQNRSLKMKRILMETPRKESKSCLGCLSTNKTCPTCGKTYSRASDMRRHQKTHTGERPFQCLLCHKSFQFQYDLKRHKLNVCQNISPQASSASPKTLKAKTTQDPEQCEVCGQIIAAPSEMSGVNHNITGPIVAPHHCSTCMGAQKLRAHEKACAKNQHLCLPAKGAPPTAEQNDLESCRSTVLSADGEQNQLLLMNENYEYIQNTSEIQCKLCTRTLAYPSLMENHSKTCKASTVHEDVDESQEKTQNVIQNSQPGRISKSSPLDELVESTLGDRHQDQGEHAAKTTETNVGINLKDCPQSLTKALKKCKQLDNHLYFAESKRSFPDMAKFETHNLRQKPRLCTMCDGSFSGLVDLNQHYLNTHNFSGPFPCTSCERSYTDLKGLVRHERVHTGDLPFKCPKCPKAFSYASALKLHDRTHTKEAPFLCLDCGKGCKSNAALRIHRLCCHSSTEERRFSCEHCGKPYALKRSLDLHVAKVHTGVRYPCLHCGKLFRSASSLTRHDLTHTQERPYSCKECAKSFRSASELKIHTRYHTGERPFKCDVCGKGFVQSYYLTAHMRMHTGERPYKCPTCEKCFKSAGILKRHQMTHTGEKPHRCSVCEMSFSRPELLKAHVRKSH